MNPYQTAPSGAVLYGSILFASIIKSGVKCKNFVKVWLAPSCPVASVFEDRLKCIGIRHILLMLHIYI